MIRFLKYALVWFVALALPVQGFAAVTMLCCGSGQNMSAFSQSHHAELDMAQAADALAHHAPMKADTLSYHHGDTTAALDVDTQHAPHAKTDSKTNCSACAACCPGAAVVPDVLSEMPIPEPPGLTIPSFYPSQFTAHIPGTPQRPPLLFLL